MPRFAANLSLMFNEVDFMARFQRAARAGFPGVEFLFPYAHDADEIARQLAAHDLEQVLFNAPPGDWQAGERGIGRVASGLLRIDRGACPPQAELPR